MLNKTSTKLLRPGGAPDGGCAVPRGAEGREKEPERGGGVGCTLAERKFFHLGQPATTRHVIKHIFHSFGIKLVISGTPHEELCHSSNYFHRVSL